MIVIPFQRISYGNNQPIWKEITKQVKTKSFKHKINKTIDISCIAYIQINL